MFSLKNTIILSMVSMVYAHGAFGEEGNSVFQNALKKLNVDETPLFPETDFTTYDRPELEVRSFVGEHYIDDEPALVEEKRKILFKRSELNSTEIAKEFMAVNYPNLEYIFTDIMDFEESDIASIHMAQAINGVEILNTAININIDKLSGGIISSGVSIWEDIEPSSNAVSDAAPLDLKEAIALVNEQLEFSSEPVDVNSLQIEKALDNHFKVTGVPYSYDGTLLARKLYTAVSETKAEQIWELTVEIDFDYVVFCVSIDTRSIIQLQDLTNHATYRVVPLNMPHIGNSARVTYKDPYLEKYSPLGWHNNNVNTFTDTRGNNIFVVENSDGDDSSSGNKYISGGSNLKFEFTYNEDKKTVEENQNAAGTNVFYLTNLLHDVFYKLGFTEAYGNFQYTNFSGKGKDRDPVVVRVSDRYGKNNAQMSCGVDGVAPVLRLFPFYNSKTKIERDPAFDNQIVIHEFTHGVSNRLTGGPSTVKCLIDEESNALNEGFSDFFANALQYRSTKNRNTPIYLFQYVIDNARTYPITSNQKLNPLMYSNLSHQSGDPNFVYNGCEIWSAILHEVFWNVVENYKKNENFFLNTEQDLSYSPSNYLVMRLVIDGMKLQPCNPTFISARDSILQAVDNFSSTSTKLKCLFWVGFARRGLGVNAKTKSVKNDKILYYSDQTIPSECKSYKNF